MIGKYEIEVCNNRVHYFLTVERNITVLQGKSATGKSELIRLISDFEENGASSGITLKCSARCTVLTSVDWQLRLDSLHDHIIFIDETAGFLKTREFAQKVRGSDNYFVIVSRDPLEELPYSVEEIYGLRNAGGSSEYQKFKRVYNEMYHLYHLTVNRPADPKHVITEDSGSGYQCFEHIYPGKCRTAEGKSNIYRYIRNAGDDSLLVIVDGAAFGSEIAKIMDYVSAADKKCVIYAPESFEYLLLKSGILSVSSEVLNQTYLFADSSRYLSWEEFYTSFLTKITVHTVYEYRKSKLKSAYLTAGNIQKIIAVLPEQIQPSSVHQKRDQDNYGGRAENGKGQNAL